MDPLPDGIVAFHSAATGGNIITTLAAPSAQSDAKLFWASTPVAPGTYRLRAEVGNLSVSPGTSALVTVEKAQLSLVVLGCTAVGQHLRHSGCYVQARVQGQYYTVPEDLVVSLASSSVSILEPAAPTVTIKANQGNEYFAIDGVLPKIAPRTAS